MNHWRHPDGTLAHREGLGRFISEREPVQGSDICTDYSRFGFYAAKPSDDREPLSGAVIAIGIIGNLTMWAGVAAYVFGGQ